MNQYRTTLLTEFRTLAGKALPFVAGTLMGTALWVPVFVASAVDTGDWRQSGLFGAVVLFVAGWLLRAGIGRTAPSAGSPAAATPATTKMIARYRCPATMCTDRT